MDDPEVYVFLGHNNIEIDGKNAKQVQVPEDTIVVSFVNVGVPASEIISSSFYTLCKESKTNPEYIKWIKDPITWKLFIEAYLQ